MSVLGQFLMNNLLPALVAGSLAWALVHVAVNVFDIRHGKLRMCLYMAPLINSTLVLLGLTTVLRWPRQLFGSWSRAAVPPETLWPFFVALTGAGLLVRWALVRRSRRQLVACAVPAPEEGRLVVALDGAMAAYQRNAKQIAAHCRLEALPGRPELLLADNLSSPAVVTSTRPAIVFPVRLVDQLADDELEGAMAHELAHLYLRQPGSCYSSENVRIFAMLNPFAGVMAAHLHREEEKACDDVAVDVVGDPDRYAGMLMRSYEYATAHSGGLVGRLQYVPQLLGVRPMLSERVEHLMQRSSEGGEVRQRVGFAVTWALLIVLFFNT